jgi:hypothetical protein
MRRPHDRRKGAAAPPNRRAPAQKGLTNISDAPKRHRRDEDPRRRAAGIFEHIARRSEISVSALAQGSRTEPEAECGTLQNRST